MILCYSGTGNSLCLAKELAGLLGDNVFSINDAIKNNNHPQIDDDTLIIVTPVYGWRVPRIVGNWLRECKNFKGKRIYFVITCGQDIGDAGSHACKLANGCGMKYMGTVGILMPENYIAMFDCPSEEESVRIVAAAKKKIKDVAGFMVLGKRLPSDKESLVDKLKSGIANDFFYKVCVSSKKFYVKDTCIGCGLCEKICPLNNIKMIEDRPVWDNNCTHCMACICHCKPGAIEYGKSSVGKRRYTCPEN